MKRNEYFLENSMNYPHKKYICRVSPFPPVYWLRPSYFSVSTPPTAGANLVAILNFNHLYLANYTIFSQEFDPSEWALRSSTEHNTELALSASCKDEIKQNLPKRCTFTKSPTTVTIDLETRSKTAFCKYLRWGAIKGGFQCVRAGGLWYGRCVPTLVIVRNSVCCRQLE